MTNMFRFLLLLTVCGIVLASDFQREEKSSRESGWSRFWRKHGLTVAKGVAKAAPILLLGRRNTEAEKREFANYLARPEVVDRDVIQKRFHTEDSATEAERANYGGIKRDIYEGADRILTTRNNFVSAKRVKRLETSKEKRE